MAFLLPPSDGEPSAREFDGLASPCWLDEGGVWGKRMALGVGSERWRGREEESLGRRRSYGFHLSSCFADIIVSNSLELLFLVGIG